MIRSRVTLAGWAAMLALAATARADEPKWKQHTINGQSVFEAAGVLRRQQRRQARHRLGRHLVPGADWKAHHVRDVERDGTYYNYFATLPLDVNGDGKIDFVTCRTSARRRLGREPGKAGEPGPITRSTCPATARRPGWST